MISAVRVAAPAVVLALTVTACGSSSHAAKPAAAVVSSPAPAAPPSPTATQAALDAYRTPLLAFLHTLPDGDRALDVRLAASLTPGAPDVVITTTIPAHTRQDLIASGLAGPQSTNDAEVREGLAFEAEHWLSAHPALPFRTVDVLDATRSGAGAQASPVPRPTVPSAGPDLQQQFQAQQALWPLLLQQPNPMLDPVGMYWFTIDGKWYLTLITALPARGPEVPADAVRLTDDGGTLATAAANWAHGQSSYPIAGIRVVDADVDLVGQASVT